MIGVSNFHKQNFFHKTSSISDHNPLLLQLFSRTQRKKHGKIFCFEAIWLKEASYEEVVSSSWEEGLILNADFPLIQFLENCRAKLDV